MNVCGGEPEITFLVTSALDWLTKAEGGLNKMQQ
jgi:hypothetical protein